MAHILRVSVDMATLMSAQFAALPLSVRRTVEVAAGTLTNEADTAVQLKYTIAAAGSQEIDLNAITGPNGETISFAAVNGLIVWSPTRGAYGNIADGATNPWAGLGTDYAIPWAGEGISIPIFVPLGIAVGGSSKTVKFANDSGISADIYIVVLGRD